MHAGFQPHVLLPVFWMKSIFWIKVPWLSKEERNRGDERRPQAKEGCTGRVCGVEFFFCLAPIQVIELHSKESFWGWSLTNSLLPSGESVLQSQGKTWREQMQKETREGYLKYRIHFEKSNMSLVSITMWSKSFKSLIEQERKDKQIRHISIKWLQQIICFVRKCIDKVP